MCVNGMSQNSAVPEFYLYLGTRKTVDIGKEYQFLVRHRKIIDYSSSYMAVLDSGSPTVDLKFTLMR